MKEKLLLIMLALFLFVGLTACDTKTSYTDNTTSSTESVEIPDDATTKQDDGKFTIQTKHFSIKVPKEWEELCSYEIDEMSISFTHKKSAAYDGYGGYLFSISIKDLSSYYDYGGEKIIGGISIPEIGEFNVWQFGPSDVQAPNDTYDEYLKCENEIDNIISTISFNDGYHFSKTPYEIKDNESTFVSHDESITEENTSVHSYEKKPVIEDWKIKSIAEDYFRNVLKNQLTSEARKKGITMAITVSGTQIISRSEHTASVRSRLNYTSKESGVRDTGNLYAVAIIDIFTGEILSAELQ